MKIMLSKSDFAELVNDIFYDYDHPPRDDHLKALVERMILHPEFEIEWCD